MPNIGELADFGGCVIRSNGRSSWKQMNVVILLFGLKVIYIEFRFYLNTFVYYLILPKGSDLSDLELSFFFELKAFLKGMLHLTFDTYHGTIDRSNVYYKDMQALLSLKDGYVLWKALSFIAGLVFTWVD